MRTISGRLLLLGFFCIPIRILILRRVANERIGVLLSEVHALTHQLSDAREYARIKTKCPSFESFKDRVMASMASTASIVRRNPFHCSFFAIFAFFPIACPLCQPHACSVSTFRLLVQSAAVTSSFQGVSLSTIVIGPLLLRLHRSHPCTMLPLMPTFNHPF
jgi:hypothetical protein